LRMNIVDPNLRPAVRKSVGHKREKRRRPYKFASS